MEVTNAFFCDAATVDAAGKINALGIFSVINATIFPATHPQMSLVIIIEPHRSEIGKHQIIVNFVNEDGKNFLPPMQNEFEIITMNQHVSFTFNIYNVTFPQAGVYSADIVIDKHHLRTVSITVNQVN
jgi:hypothetical protein